MSIVGIILAAGLSSRMGEANKLIHPWNGKPLLLYCIEAALESDLERIVVVTGHEADCLQAMLPDEVEVVRNPEYETGLASSLQTGVEAAQKVPGIRGVMVMLGDMPLLTAVHLRQMTTAFDNAPDGSIVRATAAGKGGNPVLFPVTMFPNLLKTVGDQGAKSVLTENHDKVVGVEIGDAAARDFDTPEAFNS